MTSKYFLISFLIATLIMLCACKDENNIDNEGDITDLSFISQEDFMDTLTGEWYVYRFNHYYASQPSLISIYFEGDEIRYFSGNDTEVYSITDTQVCILPEIEKIQFWNFTSSNDRLLLETDDLCNLQKSFKVEFDNYRWLCYLDPETGEKSRTEWLVADIRLVNPDTSILLNEFAFSSFHQSLDFRLDEGENSWLFRLYRR